MLRRVQCWTLARVQNLVLASPSCKIARPQLNNIWRVARRTSSPALQLNTPPLRVSSSLHISEMDEQGSEGQQVRFSRASFPSTAVDAYSVHSQLPHQKKPRGPQHCTKCSQHQRRPVLRRGHECLFKDGVLAPPQPAISTYPPSDGPVSISAVARFLHAPGGVDAMPSTNMECEGSVLIPQNPQAVGSLLDPLGDGPPVIGPAVHSAYAPAPAPAISAPGHPGTIGDLQTNSQDVGGANRSVLEPLIAICDSHYWHTAQSQSIRCSYRQPRCLRAKKTRKSTYLAP